VKRGLFRREYAKMAAMPLVLDSRDLQAAGWTPPMDVIERPHGVEIRLDLPGVPIEAIRVAVRAGALVVSGDKPPAACCPGAAFHVAERACGRFSRTVPLRLAFDASAIRASLAQGELRIDVPRIEERRGREILIPVVAS
jgi:HSP20 family protein